MSNLLIGNRRYTGSKRSLLKDIYSVIEPFCNGKTVFADLFAGTGIVSDFMLKKNINVIVNDLLYSNYIAYNVWFGKQPINYPRLEKIIRDFNGIDVGTLKDNYFSEIYGNKYFSNNDARKIGFIRDKIDELKLNKREKDLLVVSLMYETDKIANTVGHFEHFLSKKPSDRGVLLRVPHLTKYVAKSSIHNMDANKLVRSLKCDIAYIDPPYNARQYVNFYHVLENLARWDKPKDFEGISMKFKRNHLKSEYSRKRAPEVFEDLIMNLNAKVIVVSYNNTYTAKSTASNNKISYQEILNILSKRGKVTVTEIKHKSFNSGKTHFSDHKELLYVCQITK